MTRSPPMSPLPAREPNLSTRQLRAFVALADERSFTRAAAAIHLSQPAFSALIRTLEDELRTRLFDRDTRSVQLTAEGKLFEPSARRLLGDVGEAVSDLSDHVERRKGRVHVAALPSLAAGHLPAIFAEFTRRWPGIDLTLSDLLSDACVALVRNGQADFALAATGASHAGLHAQLLCTDRFYLVCRKDHPLAGEKKLPLPDHCPACRHRERMALRSERQLYRSTCAKCKDSMLSVYPPDSPYIVYCHKCFWENIG